MDLLDIGVQCSVSSCKELDFLPIICYCKRYFCRNHIAPDLHSCTSVLDHVVTKSTNPSQNLLRCADADCSKLSLSVVTVGSSSEDAATCSRCQKSFCAQHRHPKSHSCPVEQPASTVDSGTARALLAKNFPQPSNKSTSTPTRRTTKIPTDPAKLAQYHKVELLKMRHRAIAGDPKDKATTPLDQRLHVKVMIDTKTEKVFWFRKPMVTGKVLDLLSTQLGMVSSDARPLQLFRVSPTEPDKLLRNDRSFVDEVEDGCTLAVRCAV